MPLTSEGGEWKQSESFSKSFDEVWTACVETLERKGFKVGTQDKVARRIETEWKVMLAPHYRAGHRDKVTVEIVEGGGFRVRIQASRDVNDNPRTPMSEKDAEWISAGGDDALTEEMLMLLKLRLKRGGLDD